MDVESAIRTRRTHKAYGSEPIDRGTVDELLELARWAPNHHLTNPWRFRVARPARARAAEGGRRARRRRRSSTGRRRWSSARARSAATRSPTRRICTRPRSPPTSSCWPRTLAGSSATGGPRRSCAPPEGRAAVGLGDERALRGLIHLGHPVQEKPAPEREPARIRDGVPRLMLARDAAMKAVTGERFDVVVIGGGITGAGVALDAASRGYSVALVERDDYAIGTSSRSSKMVHGGLRYLQNFDLGLVREALLERQLMVQLAPHLVYPTPFLVPTLGDGKRSRTIGIGLNMYDVMATTRVGMSRRERAERAAGDDYWAPDRHRTIDGDELVELVPALAARDPRDAYLFYDCQTDDVRLVLTILGEAERYGAVFVNGAEVTGLLDRDGSGRRRRLRRRRERRALRGRGRQRGQRDRRLGRPHPAGGDPRRGGGAEDRAEPRHPRHGLAREAPAQPRGVHRPGRRGANDLRPALVRAGADRDHRQRLRRRHHPRQARRRGHRLPARGGELVLRHRARPRPTSPAPTRACGR